MEQKYRLKLAAVDRYTSFLSQPRPVARGIQALLRRPRSSVRARYLASALTRGIKEASYFRKVFSTRHLRKRHQRRG